MTWNLSTIVAEIFYCVIGALFAMNGVKALKEHLRNKDGKEAMAEVMKFLTDKLADMQ